MLCVTFQKPEANSALQANTFLCHHFSCPLSEYVMWRYRWQKRRAIEMKWWGLRNKDSVEMWNRDRKNVWGSMQLNIKPQMCVRTLQMQTDRFHSVRKKKLCCTKGCRLYLPLHLAPLISLAVFLYCFGFSSCLLSLILFSLSLEFFLCLVH